MKLRLAPTFTVDESFATEGVVVIGVRGSGKSNSEVVWCEQLHDAGIPWVAIDPKGDWWGMRLEGERPGLPIPVFGGLHGDGPLTPEMGVQIADLLVDHNMSAILDISRLTKGGQARFLVDFFDRLMERHQAEPHVRNVVFEEAHRYIPQQVPTSMAKLKEAAAAILLEGRSFGLGCWACTQRPARLHNDVLEEVDSAIIHRIGVTATADLKRVRDWVKHEELSSEISESLTKLQNGEAWVLSPVALGVVQRVRFNRRSTFDSGATPSTQISKRKLSTMADIDMAVINEQLAESIERAQAEDPKVLQHRIRELEATVRQLEARGPEIQEVVREVVVDELPDDIKAAIDEYDRTRVGMFRDIDLASSELAAGWERIHRLVTDHVPGPTMTTRPPSGTPRDPTPPARPAVPRPAPASVTAGPGDGTVGGASRKVLTVVVQHGSRTQQQVACLAGISPKSSTLRGALADLRKRGYIDHGQPITVTPEGIAALGPYDPLPVGPELRRHWQQFLGDGADRKVFDAIVDAYPRTLDDDSLAAATGIPATSSTKRGALAKLRKLGFITGWTLDPDFYDSIS